MPTVSFMTLGCKVNQFETETIEGLFHRVGYQTVPFGEAADVCVINTCSVTALGEKKSRQIIRRARRENENAIIVATGCYAQLSPQELAKLDGVRLVVGTRDRARIVELVEQAAREDGVIFDVGDIMAADSFEDIPLYDAPTRTRAFLKIQEGCENFCTFCIIPYARGPLRSRPLESVRREAKKLIDAGFKEIVLTGEILALGGLSRLRLGSLESVELSDELFALLRDEPRLAKHLHLPLQAGSDAILHAMNRHYDTATFARLLENVRRNIPDVSITTDVIVGFPGETDALFEESLDFVSRMGFAKVHVFPYSRREGTPAARMEGQLPTAVKKERVRRMEEAAETAAKAFREQFLGKTEDVLFETETEGISDGLTGGYFRVYTDAPMKLGEIAPMRLVRLHQDGFWGEMC